jgi:hypothetical protein
MYSRLNQTRKAFLVILGEVILGSVGLLLIWDVFPQLFPAKAHDTLASFPLAMIALASLVYQCARPLARMELTKAIILAFAFLFWAANQLMPNYRHATLFNDIAIALLVLDVFLVIVGSPATTPDESFVETFVGQSRKR